MRHFEQALIVSEDPGLLSRISRLLVEELGIQTVRVAGGVEVLLDTEWSPDLVLIEVPLAGRDALSAVERVARRHPAPLILAIGGQDDAEEAFRLGQAGLHSYLPQPFSTRQLAARLRCTSACARSLEPQASALVGHRGLRDVVREVRQAMFLEAIAQAGSCRGAARLLGVSRQSVQQAVGT